MVDGWTNLGALSRLSVFHQCSRSWLWFLSGVGQAAERELRALGEEISQLEARKQEVGTKPPSAVHDIYESTHVKH